MRWIPVVLALAFATTPPMSGCIGSSGDEGGEPVNETSAENASNESAPGENRSSSENGTDEGPSYGDANETGSENETSSESQATWKYDNRTGSFSGVNAVAASEGSAEETFTVEPNALQLALNLSADGGEIEMCLTKPSGNESGGNESGNTTQQQSCDETVTTKEGNATFTAQAPTQGEWKATLRPADPGPHQIEYELAIGQRIQEESGF